MTYFVGTLDDVSLQGNDLELRMNDGGVDPLPPEPPVLYVTIQRAERAEACYESLLQLLGHEDAAYFTQSSEREAVLHVDHGDEVRLRGEAIQVRPSSFEPRDFKRLAEASHSWGSDLLQSLNRAHERNTEAHNLVIEQVARVQVKLRGHEPGSTARTLYEQQLAFLNRLLASLGV